MKLALLAVWALFVCLAVSVAGAGCESPGPRQSHTAIMNLHDSSMIIFGGGDGTNSFNDAWSWHLDTAMWNEIQAGGKPLTRIGHASAYNAGDSTVVIFGGKHGGTFMSDTWRLSPGTGLWDSLEVSGSIPPGRDGHCAAYDPTNHALVIWGGTDGSGDSRYYDGWWSGVPACLRSYSP